MGNLDSMLTLFGVPDADIQFLFLNNTNRAGPIRPSKDKYLIGRNFAGHSNHKFVSFR
jgi:hypothetical protein